MVRQIPPPPAARARSTLSRIDYADAFLVDTGPGQTRTGEQWARVVLEDAPRLPRRGLPYGWLALGLTVTRARSDQTVLGWELRRSTPEFALLGTGSRTGMPAELLFEPRDGALLFATFVQHQNPMMRAVWAAAGPPHRRIVPYLLRCAAGA